MSRFFPTVLLDEYIGERSAVADMLKAEGMDKAADRVTREITRLEALKLKAENWHGPVAEVSGQFGYTPSHLHTLVKDGFVENVAPEGEAREVRYADVLNHRLKDVPSDDAPARSPKTNGAAPRTNGPTRPTRKNGPQVKVKAKRR